MGPRLRTAKPTTAPATLLLGGLPQHAVVVLVLVPVVLQQRWAAWWSCRCATAAGIMKRCNALDGGDAMPLTAVAAAVVNPGPKNKNLFLTLVPWRYQWRFLFWEGVPI